VISFNPEILKYKEGNEVQMRYFIKLAYNGSLYHGWYQPNASSIQETMNKAISTLLNSEISISREDRYRCSRKEMYAHFDFEAPFDIPSLVHKLNSFLPKIVIYDIIAVKEAAHARFDALKNL
jgi:tRNA pseudouridine38-40 synthase